MIFTINWKERNKDFEKTRRGDAKKVKEKAPSCLGKKYKANVYWTDEDYCYVVSIPGILGLMTHGDTIEEALDEAAWVLESFKEIEKEDAKGE